MRRNAAHNLRLGALALLALGMVPSPALASDFTPEGTANWIDIATRLTVSVDSGNTHPIGVCEGINAFAAVHANFRKEVETMHTWAPRTHVFTCMAFSAKVPKLACKYYRMASDELTKAKPGSDPEAAVAAASRLKAALDSVTGEMKADKLC